MSTPYLDKTGFAYFVSKIKSALSGKAAADLSNVDDSVFAEKAAAAGAGGIPEVAITSTDGVNYTGTIANMTALTAGKIITVIPDMTSTSTAAKLNINSLGAKTMKQSVTYSSSITLAPANAGWMVANKPITLQYDGTYWRTLAPRTNANDIYGTVKVEDGGTGADNAAEALTNLGITYGTADLTAGTSSLATGAIYLVYEEA